MKGVRTALVILMYVLCSFASDVQATDFLFVQTASGATLNNGTLTLTGVADKTTYFSDRPERVAGRMSTEDFVTLFELGGTFSEVRGLASSACCVHVCMHMRMHAPCVDRDRM